MLQLASVMQQLPAENGQISLKQLENVRETMAEVQAQPQAYPAPTGLLVEPAQRIDIYA